MKGLFKNIGHGFLFIVIFPFWLIVFALFTIWSIFTFFFTFLTAIPAYFRGESILGHSELDVGASTKIAEAKLLQELPPSAPISQAPPMTINVYTNPVYPEQLPTQQKYIEKDGTIYRQLSASEQRLLSEKAVVQEEKE